MTDNTTITPGTGVTVAADDVGGALHQRVKATWGPDGTGNDVDIASGKAMPVQLRSATGLIPLGEPTDAKSTATDTTSASGISIWKQISASVQLMVFGAGTAAAAQRVTHASDDPAVATLGATTGAAVITDANGTIQQYLRGLVKRWVDALGTGTAAAALRVTVATDVGLPAGTSLLGKVKTKFIAAVGSTLTRAANTTAYTALDSISDNATPGSVTANTVAISDINDEPITVEAIRLVSTDTGVRGKSVRLHLYSSNPTSNSGVGGGDNLAFSNKIAGAIGTFSGTFSAVTGAYSDGALAVLVPDQASRRITKPGSGAQTLWWQLQTLDDFTPSATSTTFIPTFEGFQGAA